MFKAIKSAWGRRYIQNLCREEYRKQRFHPNERPVEYRFLFEQLAELNPANVLDIGSGATAVPAVMAQCGVVVTAIDNVRDFWPEGMTNRHFHILDEDITAPKLDRRFDLISCVSVLEHIRDSGRAVEAMFRLLAPGGHLVLTCPYSEPRYCPNVYEQPDSDAFGHTVPYICQSYSGAELRNWVERSHAVVVKQEFWRFYSGEFWSCGSRVAPPRSVDRNEPHQLTCLLLRTRE